VANPSIKFNVNVIDKGLQDKIVEMSRATGKTVKEQTRLVMKGMVRDVINFTPPSSQKATGTSAKGAGETAIARDMGKLFIPVTLKGKGKEKWPDPHKLHHEAMQAAAGGKVATPTQRYHVDKAKLTSLRNVLKPHVGLLASGWVTAANSLGVSVPAWVARHSGSGRGTDLIITENEKQITMKVINHFPNTASALADQTKRLIAFAKKAAIGSMTRQLPYILKKNLAGR
jgi:hypothetical protein